MNDSIILINGKKRSGKDHNAKLIKEELESRGYTVDIISYADAVKDILCISLGIHVDLFDDLKNDTYDIFAVKDGYQDCPLTTVRALIQNFGTEAMKKYFGEDVWVRILLSKAYESDANYIIVPDFRFLSEAISDTTIKIINNDLEDSDSHRSENELNDFEFKYTIDNTGYPDTTDSIKKIVDDIV